MIIMIILLSYMKNKTTDLKFNREDNIVFFYVLIIPIWCFIRSNQNPVK